jgi:hypothetical protein
MPSGLEAAFDIASSFGSESSPVYERFGARLIVFQLESIFQWHGGAARATDRTSYDFAYRAEYRQTLSIGRSDRALIGCGLDIDGLLPAIVD